MINILIIFWGKKWVTERKWWEQDIVVSVSCYMRILYGCRESILDLKDEPPVVFEWNKIKSVGFIISKAYIYNWEIMNFSIAVNWQLLNKFCYGFLFLYCRIFTTNMKLTCTIFFLNNLVNNSCWRISFGFLLQH